MHTSDLDVVVAIFLNIALAGGPEPVPADRDRMATEIAAGLKALNCAK